MVTTQNHSKGHMVRGFSLSVPTVVFPKLTSALASPAAGMLTHFPDSPPLRLGWVLISSLLAQIGTEAAHGHNESEFLIITGT
jgi:hypothetical protein